MSVRNAIILCLIIEAGLIALGFVNYGWTISALQAATRFSGRFSLLIFSVLFLAHHPDTTHTWLSSKPFLIFALAHGIHLIELLSYLYISGTPVIPYRLAGGFVAYALIFAMPLFCQKVERGTLSIKRFNLITIIFQYYVWGVFFLTYLPRVRGMLPGVGGSYVEHVVLLGWLSLMLGMKVPRVLYKRRRTTHD